MALHVFDLESFSLSPVNPGDWNVDGLNRMFFQAHQLGGGLASLMKAGTYKVQSSALTVLSGVDILIGPNVIFVDWITLAPIPTLDAVTVNIATFAGGGGGSGSIGTTNALLAATPGTSTGLTAPQIRFTVGAVFAGDGGGGGYYWNDTSTAVADGALILGAFVAGRWIKFL
jgi:hypothetical protein